MGFEERVSMRELQPDHVLQEVIGVLRDLCPHLEPEDSWAKLKAPVFDLLRKLGTKADFKVWHADDTGTYLWDICWTHEPHPPYWVELVGEVELTDQYQEEILHDFYTVLDAKARLKIFMTAAPSRVKAEQLKHEIEWAVKNQRFRLPEERLAAILIILNNALWHVSAKVSRGRLCLRSWQNRPRRLL
jgi:hypothetical protein